MSGAGTEETPPPYPAPHDARPPPPPRARGATSQPAHPPVEPFGSLLLGGAVGGGLWQSPSYPSVTDSVRRFQTPRAFLLPGLSVETGPSQTGSDFESGPDLGPTWKPVRVWIRLGNRPGHLSDRV